MEIARTERKKEEYFYNAPTFFKYKKLFKSHKKQILADYQVNFDPF